MIHLEVWSDVECGGGTRLAVVVGVGAGKQVQALNAEEALEFIAPRYDDEGQEWVWVSDLGVRRVIRVEDDDTGEVWEWRISSILTETTQGGEELVRVAAKPIVYDLGRAFLLEHRVTGGPIFRNLGGVGLSPQQLIDTYILGHPECPTWWERGTVTPSEGIEISWEAYTPLELLRDIAGRFPEYELRFRRNGSTDYRIDLSATGSGLEGPPAEFGRNLLSLRREELEQDFATVIVPRGRMVSGGVELGDIGDNGWEITGKSGNNLTLADPLGGDGPILEDDQLNGLYLESATTTTRLQISDSVASTQVVTMASTPTDFAIGDVVRVVRDSSGSLMGELESPAGVAAYDRVMGTIDVPDQNAARNLVPAGALSGVDGWADASPFIIVGEVDGAHSSTTTLNIKNLPVGFNVHDFTYLVNVGAAEVANTGSVTITHQVTTGGGDVVGVDGLAQVTLSTAITATDGHPVVLFTGWYTSGTVENWPTHGSSYVLSLGNVDFGPAADMYALVYPMGADEDWPADVVGTLGETITDPMPSIALAGLAASTYYPPCCLFYYTDNSAVERGPYELGSGFITDSSGNALIWPLNPSVAFPTATSGNACRVAFPAKPRAWGVTVGENILFASSGLYNTQRLQWAGLPVRYVPGRSTLYVAAGASVMGKGVTWQQATAPNYMPKIEIETRALGSSDSWDMDTHYAASSSYTPTDYVETHHDWVGSVILTEDKEVNVRYWPYRYLSGGVSRRQWVSGAYLQALRYVSLWLGPETEPPILPGSGANVLWQKANERLAETRTPTIRYTMSLLDLSRVVGFDATAERPPLGGTMPHTDPKSGLDVSLRVMAYHMDILDPLNARVTLETSHRLATELLLPDRFTVRRPEDGQSFNVVGPEARPAVREVGAYRSQAAASSSGGTVTPEEWA